MLLEKSKIIETERLVLRELNPEIHKELMSAKTDDEIKEYFGFTTDEELATEKGRHEKGMTMFNKSFLYFYIIEKRTYKIIGSCGYHTWFFVHSRAEMGYSLFADEHKGKGFMKEAMLPIINYGFEVMNLHRIEALVGPDNIPSLMLVEHFGFTKEGVLREHYFKNNVMEDSVAFSLLRKEHEANKR